MSHVKTLLVTIILTVSLSAQGLPEDSKQPIKIESDSAESNQSTGLTEYSGNVFRLMTNPIAIVNRSA